MNHNSCCYVAFFLPSGKIIKLEGVDDVINLPYTHHNNFDALFVGRKINKKPWPQFYLPNLTTEIYKIIYSNLAFFPCSPFLPWQDTIINFTLFYNNGPVPKNWKK